MALAEYIHAKPVIDAEKVRLRPLQAADVPDIKTWTTDISVYTYWGKGPGKQTGIRSYCLRDPQNR